MQFCFISTANDIIIDVESEIWNRFIVHFKCDCFRFAFSIFAFCVSDEIADVLEALPHDMAKTILLTVDKETRVKVNQILQFKDEEAVILTNAGEFGEDIDVTRAKEAKARAEARLAEVSASIETKRAEAALARAMVRLKAALRNK